MSRVPPQVLPATTEITSGIWNNQISLNLTHLLGLKMDGTALTDFASGGELNVKTARLVSGGSIAGASPVTLNGIPVGAMGLAHLRLVVYYRTTNAAEQTTTLNIGGGGIGLTNFARSAISLVGNTVTGSSDNDVVTNLLTNCSAGIGTATNRFSLLDVNLYDLYNNDGFKVATYTHRGSIGTATNDQKYTVGGGLFLAVSAIDTIRIGITAGDFATGSKYYLYGWSA